jgi:hypothetical protein
MKNASRLASLWCVFLVEEHRTRSTGNVGTGDAQASTFTPRQKAIYPAIRRAPSFGSG